MDIISQMVVSGLALAGFLGWLQYRSAATFGQLAIRFLLAILGSAIYAGLSYVAVQAWNGHSDEYPVILSIAGTACLFFSFALIPGLCGVVGAFLVAMGLRIVRRRV